MYTMHKIESQNVITNGTKCRGYMLRAKSLCIVVC